MTINRAARVQFAIYEMVDILAEDIAARTASAIAKQECSRPQGAPHQKAKTLDTQPPARRLLRRAKVE
jgi:hypothetical protein